ncbi:hypothetical protein EJ02DRAFT_505995 [Clathrospora elynae]|uniref:TPR-like protein n=1 Tax=Clathrospora elynae TaxID=706981 RepID=A0A6A5SCQ7_9PLEO|nr:hypothetical protein EJ02DRAFT_505995 [Clathrospora elynae]
MAYSSIITTFAGPGNQGMQVGHNSGRIENHARFRSSRVALVGIGGVGKSQLAIEHYYRTAERSPETWVFWAHASNTARLEQSYREIADQAKIRGRKDPQVDVFKLVHDWLWNEKNGPWLLVLDNADDAAVLFPPPSTQADDGGNGSNGALRQPLSRYLPPSRHGSVLVTSRTKHAAEQVVEDGDIILVKSMQDAAARALLHKKLRDKGGKDSKDDNDDEDDGIAELTTTLEHMPLALQYLEAYRQNDQGKTSLLNQEAGHLRRDKVASNSILITWQISFSHIQSTRQSAADLLSLMSFFDRQGIHEALLRSQNSTANRCDDEFENDVLVLQDYSFITATNANTFEMHNLVQLATRKWLEIEGQLNKWREHFIYILCTELPTGEHENWERCQALSPHVKAALAQRPKNEKSLKEWALLLHNAAWYAWRRERADEAEHMSVMSMKVRGEVFGEENAETLQLMNRKTLARKERVLGPEHPDTLTSMSNLAGVLDSQSKYEEAELMNRQTLARKEMVLGLEHPSTLTNMNNLARVLESQGKYDEAESMNR